MQERKRTVRKALSKEYSKKMYFRVIRRNMLDAHSCSDFTVSGSAMNEKIATSYLERLSELQRKKGVKNIFLAVSLNSV